MTTIVEETSVRQWVKFDVTIDNQLAQLLMAEINGDLNRFGTWQIYGEGYSFDQMVRHYLSTGAFGRLLKSYRLVFVRQQA